MMLLWITLCLSAPPGAKEIAAQERVSIVVLPTKLLESGRGAIEDALLDEAVLAGLQSAGNFRVFGHSDINAVLDNERRKDVLSCDDSACFSEIGGALGAAALVDVKVGRADGSWIITAKLINTGSGGPQVDARALEAVEGGQAELFAHLPRIMYALLSKAGLAVHGRAPEVTAAPSRALLSVVSEESRSGDAFVDSIFVEDALMRMFAPHGITFASKGAVGDSPSEEKLLALAADKGAKLLVTGTARVSDNGSIMGTKMHALRARITLRAIDVGSGRILATAAVQSAAGHIDIQAGCEKATEKVAKRVAKELAEKIAGSRSRNYAR